MGGRRHLLKACYRNDLRELPPSKRGNAEKCCCLEGNCPGDSACKSEPEVARKSRAPASRRNRAKAAASRGTAAIRTSVIGT